MTNRNITVGSAQREKKIWVVANLLLRFRSDRRWIDIKHFNFVEDQDDQQLLSALISHQQFRDGYIGQGPGDQPVHGPYRLDAITCEKYELIESNVGINCLDNFCRLYDRSPPSCLAEDIDSVVRRRLKLSTSLFRLPPLEAAQHECGWVLDEFHELVTICRTQREVSLVIMGSD